MTYLLLQAYPWLKTAHVVSVILWMGAQLTLCFLLAAQATLPSDQPLATQLTIFEHRLVRWLLNPGILAAFAFGGLMIYVLAASTENLPVWLWIKVTLAVLLSAVHGLLVRAAKQFAAGRPVWKQQTWTSLFWLQLGMLAIIVGLVILRPEA